MVTLVESQELHIPILIFVLDPFGWEMWRMRVCIDLEGDIYKWDGERRGDMGNCTRSTRQQGN